MAWRVCSLNSNLTGRPVFFCRTVARSAVYPPEATSSTRIATTSQPRSLLSIARLNIARSRVRPSIWSFVRIDQTCFGRSGGFAPVSLPLFQGTRFGSVGVAITSSCIVILLGYRHRGEWVRRLRRWNQVGFRITPDLARCVAESDLQRLTQSRDGR